MSIWNTTDYKGQPVTWYSEDEYKAIKKGFDDLYKFNKRLIDEKYKAAITAIRYKQVLDKVKEFLKEIYEESEADTYIARSYNLITEIEDIIRRYNV